MENKFIYERELWFISALIQKRHFIPDELEAPETLTFRKRLNNWRSQLRQLPCNDQSEPLAPSPEDVDMDQKAAELKEIIERRIKNIEQPELEAIKWSTPLQDDVVRMAQSVKIHSCKWNDYLSFFPHPYLDENRGLMFDWVGFFQLELEYFPNDLAAKKTVSPIMIQQIPLTVLDHLKKGYSVKSANKSVILDTGSPIYVCVISNEMMNEPVKWSKDTIWENRREVGLWTEIYSGAWPDYSDELYAERTRDNLSNRASELHFLRRNSGFIYMEKTNYEMFFSKDDSYMRQFVLRPVAQIRSMQFALTAINHSIDTLFLLQRVHEDLLGGKIENLKRIRGNVFNQMGYIFSELDRNPRQHYTSVLNFLLKEFRFETILDRMNAKLEVFTDALLVIHHKKTQLAQDRQSQRMGILNILFGLGVLADISFMLGASFHIANGVTGEVLVYIIFTIGIISIFLVELMMWMQLQKQEWRDKFAGARHRVEAIILSAQRSEIVMVQFKFPPYAEFYALPGGYVNDKESPKDALSRCVLEDLGVKVNVLAELGEFRSSSNDPRGKIKSKAYFCQVESDAVFHVKSSLADGKYYPLDDILGMSLAYNHENILKDSVERIRILDDEEHARAQLKHKLSFRP